MFEHLQRSAATCKSELCRPARTPGAVVVCVRTFKFSFVFWNGRCIAEADENLCRCYSVLSEGRLCGSWADVARVSSRAQALRAAALLANGVTPVEPNPDFLDNVRAVAGGKVVPLRTSAVDDHGSLALASSCMCMYRDA